MAKPKHVILKKSENLIRFNQAKAKVTMSNPNISNITDEVVLEKALKHFLKEDE